MTTTDKGMSMRHTVKGLVRQVIRDHGGTAARLVLAGFGAAAEYIGVEILRMVDVMVIDHPDVADDEDTDEIEAWLAGLKTYEPGDPTVINVKVEDLRGYWIDGTGEQE